MESYIMDKTTVSLSVFDRILLRSIILDKKDNVGSLEALRHMLNILNKIEITDEENEQYNIEVTGQKVTWSFSEDKDYNLSNAQKTVISNLIKEKKDWALDSRILDFVKKFGVSLESSDEDDEDQ